jgi:hypothetical protein
MVMSPLLAALGLAACGGEGAVDPAPSLFPLAVGRRWVYRVTERDGAVEEKVQTVTGTTSEGGALAYRLVTARGGDETRSVQRVDEGGRLVRLREEVLEGGAVIERLRFVPAALRLDLVRTAQGISYDSAHVEERLDAGGAVVGTVSKALRFEVEAVDERVVVPAGEFRALRLRREGESGVVKTFWYAFGVGKVKESGGQTEELVRVEPSAE